MFDREYLDLRRIMDDGKLRIRRDKIVALADNANEHGLIEGSCTILMDSGLAFAVNHSTAEVEDMIRALELFQ